MLIEVIRNICKTSNRYIVVKLSKIDAFARRAIVSHYVALKWIALTLLYNFMKSNFHVFKTYILYTNYMSKLSICTLCHPPKLCTALREVKLFHKIRSWRKLKWRYYVVLILEACHKNIGIKIEPNLK